MNYALPLKEVLLPHSYHYRVMFLNPAKIYERINLQPFARHQLPENIGMQVMFPKQAERVCACGCNQPLPKGRSRWASNDCASFAGDVYQIIYGQLDVIKFYLKKYHGYKCKCGRVRKMKLDHMVPVKHGGGGCWLSNYQFLCHNCHVLKTNTDFGWKKPGSKIKSPATKPAPLKF